LATPRNPAQAEAEDSSKIKDRLEALLFAETLQGTLVPECEPRKGVNWRLSLNLMPKLRGFSGQLRHLFTCPRLDLLYQSERRLRKGRIKKGGDVTFHGPGQLVGYPIFDLRGYPSSQLSAVSSQLEALDSEAELAPLRRKTLGAVDYVRRLEEVLIRTCGDFGIPTRRVTGLTGAWTVAETEAKIAAIGVHISRSVTSHGFA
jgi:hypothetical protein